MKDGSNKGDEKTPNRSLNRILDHFSNVQLDSGMQREIASSLSPKLLGSLHVLYIHTTASAAMPKAFIQSGKQKYMFYSLHTKAGPDIQAQLKGEQVGHSLDRTK
jgi:hypothetical protein